MNIPHMTTSIMKTIAALSLCLLCSSCRVAEAEPEKGRDVSAERVETPIPLRRGTAGQLGEMGSIGEIGDDAAVIVTHHGSGMYLNGIVLCVKKGEHWDVQQFYDTVLSHGGTAFPRFFSYNGKTLSLYNDKRKEVALIPCGAICPSPEAAADAKWRLGKKCIRHWTFEFPGIEDVGRALIREAADAGHAEAKAFPEQLD